MTDASALILHQYEVSPFSEKVRVALGIKGLAWQACNQPSIMPKPEMVRLTGGFRRIPMLQVGADLYFDSLYIIEELDRRFPAKPALAASGIGVSTAAGRLIDGEMFMGVVGLLFGGDWTFDEAFIKDRSELMGRPFDPKEFASAGPMLTFQLRQHLDLFESQLADGRAFLMGDKPDAMDAALFCQTAFIRWGQGKTAAVVDQFPGVCAWEKRVAALGHGERGADVSDEDAIAIAKAASPAPIGKASSADDFSAGDKVRIKFHDANSAPLDGTLLSIDLRTLSLRPAASECGEINIHMPRAVGAISRL